MKIQVQILFCLFALLSLSSCYSLNKLESGRTLGQGTHEVAFTGSITPSVIEVLENPDKEPSSSPSFTGDIHYKYGITEKIDLGARIGLSGVMFDLKTQLIGNQDSDFALSTGLSIGQGIGGKRQLEVPVFMSYRVSDNTEFTLAPRFYQGALYNSPERSDIGIGTSAGVLFGEKNLIGFEVSYMHFAKNNAVRQVDAANLSAGFKFRF